MHMARNFCSTCAGILLLSILGSAPPADAEGGYVFLTAWGTYGSGVGQFLTPQGVAVSTNGDVYVADGDNERVQVFTSGGMFLRMWSVWSTSVALDASDNVYVGGGGWIRKFTSTGVLVEEWVAGHFYSHAVDEFGNIYIADYLDHRIVVYTNSGVYLRHWGSFGSENGQFKTPDGVAVDAGGSVYVADKYNYRVQKFANDGTFLTQWGGPGNGDGQFGGPVRLAIGPQGNVYVVDNANSRIQVFTSEGTFLTKWGTYGTSPGQFDNPIGIAIDAIGDIYVADTNNSRIQKFGLATTAVQAESWGSVKARYRGERTAQPQER